MKLFPQAFLSDARSNSDTKKKYANSQGWRAVSKNARPDGRFLELRDGVGHSAEVISVNASTTQLAPADYRNNSTKNVLISIKNIEDV
jgi:hypothetical protein